MNNDARVEPETKLLLEILGGFRVSSLGQVGLFLWVTQARQLYPNGLQPKTYFSLKPVSELKLIVSGQSSAETGFLPVPLRLASTPTLFPTSGFSGAQPHACSAWLLQITEM